MIPYNFIMELLLYCATHYTKHRYSARISFILKIQLLNKELQEIDQQLCSALCG